MRLVFGSTSQHIGRNYGAAAMELDYYWGFSCFATGLGTGEVQKYTSVLEIFLSALEVQKSIWTEILVSLGIRRAPKSADFSERVAAAVFVNLVCLELTLGLTCLMNSL
ncbi:hypothetical protein U1Q18_044328 [Sarracenia purpurea var. burkii]